MCNKHDLVTHTTTYCTYALVCVLFVPLHQRIRDNSKPLFLFLQFITFHRCSCSAAAPSSLSSLDLFSPSPHVLQESDKDIINAIKTFRFLLLWSVIKNSV